MNDKNIKMKTSIVPRNHEDLGQKDSFKKGGTVEAKKKIAAGDHYKPGDQRTSSWKAMNAGGAKGLAIPGLPDEDILGELGEFCTEANRAPRGYSETYHRNFTPQTDLDAMRIFYESPDITKLYKLERNLPKVPSFGTMYKQFGNVYAIKNYYKNRLGLLNDFLEHSEDVIESTDNYHEVEARADFIRKCKRLKRRAKSGLVSAVQKQYAKSDDVKLDDD